jgi:hypothetical protein
MGTWLGFVGLRLGSTMAAWLGSAASIRLDSIGVRLDSIGVRLDPIDICLGSVNVRLGSALST